MSYTNGLDKPSDYFNTKLYTGDGTSSHGITGVGFQPDWIWIKRRDVAGWHYLFDPIRGANKTLYSNLDSGETTDTNNLQSFDSDGFTVGTQADMNQSGGTFVSWNWLGANGTASNTDGSITSTVSANTTSGFSVVSYTGTGSSATIGHGLGSELACYIIKQRNTTGGWIVYHQANTSSPETEYLRLDKTDSTVDDAIFNDTAPTSSVFSIGTNAPVNTSGGTYIAYCFAEKKGFSKFGSYTGNGSTDGIFVYTGFKPAFVMGKRTNSTEDWFLFDSTRDTHNVNHKLLYPNGTNAEYTGVSARNDFLSNGFKMRIIDNKENGSGSTYIYMAFAEEPFVTSTGIPGTAR